MILESWALELLLVGVGGMQGRGGIGSGVGRLRLSGGGAPVPLRLQHVCGFVAASFGKEGIRPYRFDEA